MRHNAAECNAEPQAGRWRQHRSELGGDPTGMHLPRHAGSMPRQAGGGGRGQSKGATPQAGNAPGRQGRPTVRPHRLSTARMVHMV